MHERIHMIVPHHELNDASHEFYANEKQHRNNNSNNNLFSYFHIELMNFCVRLSFSRARGPLFGWIIFV